MSVGLAIIARDETDSLPELLDSIVGAFDEVVLVDTGSTDDTVDVFWSWCKSVEQVGKVGTFEWCDDFSAARTYAESLLSTDWRVWADCDDVIENSQNIRRIVANVPAEVSALICDYQYAFDPTTGQCVCVLKRERMVRAGMGHWEGRVHEAQSILSGRPMYVPPEHVAWKHMKQVGVETFEEANIIASKSNERNLTILRKWDADEPNNPRVLAYLGTELAAQGKHAEAVPFYQRYFSASDGGWRDEYAQVCRKLASSLRTLDRDADAADYAMQALAHHPTWPDSYITLAECLLENGKPDDALHWIDQALRLGTPEQTMLIINPLDYTFLPRRIRARTLAELGRHEEALQEAERALQLFPEGALAQEANEWQQVVRTIKTAETFALCAEQLVAHDEQWKARVLLEECVPHFVSDHPRITALRSHVRERILWATDPDSYARHYRDGGSKPEDFLDDERADEVCRALPRVAFALDGILEQAGVAQ